jgi:polysaccharide deacetylase family protein (PEP-CTERM system associated)
MVRSGESSTILTVDYEDWYHILASHWTDPTIWRDLRPHVEQDTRALLDLLDRYRARATFFLVGWVAERTPDTVREIARRGHALASHGYLHVPPDEMSEAEFRSDLLRSVEVIRRIAHRPPRGYRAPGFGVRRCPYPYLRVLEECGFRYDSSWFPGLFPGRTHPSTAGAPHHPAGGGPRFWEIPISAARFLGVPISFSGGGLLRLLPAWAVRLGASRVRAQGEPLVCYLHPRDLNPGSPEIPVPIWLRHRYYGGRSTVGGKLRNILARGDCVSVEEFLANRE